MNKIFHIISMALICLVMTGLNSCTNDEPAELNLDQKRQSIYAYLQDNPDYSILVEALDRLKLNDLLNVYGTITLFAPTDAAFQTYFSEKGISGISQLDEKELSNLIRYHLYNNIYKSISFITGSLPEPTLQGGYIKMDVSQGFKNTTLNNTVKVDILDVEVTNGVVHVIDQVLVPPTKSMYDWLLNENKYSIMLEAFEKTDNLELLQDLIYSDDDLILWRTVFIETNAVLANGGILSFDDLAKKISDSYNTNKDYTNREDSLNMFVRYHCMERKYFLSDVKNDYYASAAEDLFLIFNSTPEITINKRPGEEVGVDIENSNQVTNNGIIHNIDKLLTIYEPPPVIVNQLFAGEPEDRAIEVYGVKYAIDNANVMNMLLDDPEGQKSFWWLKWEGMMRLQITSQWPADAFNDYGLYVIENPGQYSIELTTKPVFKGKYRVYISYRRGVNTNYLANFFWNDEVITTPTGVQAINVDLTRDTDQFGERCRNRGNEPPGQGTGGGGTDRQIWRGLGVVDVPKMTQCRFRFTLPNPGGHYTWWYSMQLWPLDE